MKFLILANLILLSPWLARAKTVTYTIKDHLHHQWTDELVHFPVDLAGKGTKVKLVGADGKDVPCQFTDAHWDPKLHRQTGTFWTVVSIGPGGSVTFEVRSGRSKAQSDLTLSREKGTLILANAHLALKLADYKGALPKGTGLESLRSPIQAIRAANDATWLGEGSWAGKQSLALKSASTRVVEEGPVRVVVEHVLSFADGKTYRMTIELGSRQELARITEYTDISAPETAFRFSLKPGLEPNRTYWASLYWADNQTEPVVRETSFAKEAVIVKLSPWSFWGDQGHTACATIYKEGGANAVAVIPLNPSRWSPDGWDGFRSTRIPVTARPGGELDLTFAFLAGKGPGNQEQPLRREWGIVLAPTKELVTPKSTTPTKMRFLLLKHGEFPLDQVKDYGFEFAHKDPTRPHPFLAFTKADLERTRRLAQSDPIVKAHVDAAIKSINGCGCSTLECIEKKGWDRWITEHFIGNALWISLPEAYSGSDDKRFALMMKAAVMSCAHVVADMLLEKPMLQSLGRFGPWPTGNVMQLLLYYDLVADDPSFSPQDRAYIEAVLVLGAHYMAHPDYWNTDRGLCTGPPNMTSSIKLPLGLMGLYLDGHPQAAQWLAGAEKELKEELSDWVSPGGAWLESPGYLLASTDGMFLLAQAIRNVTGRDYFADSQFKALMEYDGFLLTPPDCRFPPNNTNNVPSPMVIPSIGDTYAGTVSCISGWMAAATAKTDPAYSARQEFYWKAQNANYGYCTRAWGFTMLVTDTTLPASPATELARSFPRFGNVMRTSWTDPKAEYLCHRVGPVAAHFHEDFNSFVYYAKGAPVCNDFGNLYQPIRRHEPWYHNLVSFSRLADKPIGIGVPEADSMSLRSLPRTIDYSYGLSVGSGGQRDDRHILFVRSDDSLGANYLVTRDVTFDNGIAKQPYYFNLWCLSKEPQVENGRVHFPGQFGVDLDLHVLSPAAPQIEKDSWQWKQQIYVWADFSEEQFGIHIAKEGSKEDFLTVLYPRAKGQAPGEVTSLANGAALQVKHMEGTDIVLVSPVKSAVVTAGDTKLSGEIAFARRYTNGEMRLAVLKGENARAGCGAWSIASTGPVAVEIKGQSVSGESSGAAHEAHISLPPRHPAVSVAMDGQPGAGVREGDVLRIALPDGPHRFTIQPKLP